MPICQVDAFALGPFSGKPTTFCPLDARLDDETMQSIAPVTMSKAFSGASSIVAVVDLYKIEAIRHDHRLVCENSLPIHRDHVNSHNGEIRACLVPDRTDDSVVASLQQSI
jgi:hypothetical protein